MESNWAAEHLQVIRTLMERSAVYRRALAPIMTFSGSLGLAAGLVGWVAKIQAPQGFIGYWAGVGVLALAGAFFLVRRQALKEAEPFWSPPTRRVAQALLPALFFGFVLGLIVLFRTRSSAGNNDALGEVAIRWLPLAWIGLYGCALHASGFFMPRGMKIFGWAFVLASCAFCSSTLPEISPGPLFGHGI